MSNLLQSLAGLVPAPLRNRYIFILVFFFFWMIFIDKHDVLTQWRLARTLNKLEEDKAYYSKKIEEAKRERKDLERNGEQFARERYYLKEKGEDVYIIEEDQ